MIYRHSHKSTQRKIRTRSKIKAKAVRPRLTVFRSLKQISAQIIDDSKGVTLVSVTSLKLKPPAKNKTDAATQVGELIAQNAKKKKITKVVFDRGSYRYHGRVKSLAQAARKKGLTF